MHPYIDPKFHIISLQAPLEMNFGGYAWFPIDYTPNGIVVDLNEAKKTLEQLKNVIQFIHSHTKPNKLFLMGFSQGTIMSLGTALHLPELVDGVLGFSGRFERKMLPDQPNREAIRKLAVFQSHGISDSVIPVAAGRDAKKILEEYGVNLTYREYPFAHEISMNCLKDAMLWLKEILDAG
jgi:phospholipase/carboxylesterase